MLMFASVSYTIRGSSQLASPVKVLYQYSAFTSLSLAELRVDGMSR